MSIVFFVLIVPNVLVVFVVFDVLVVAFVLGASLCSLCSLRESGLHFVLDWCNDNQEGAMRSFLFC